jgi:hypothetical protein
MTSLGYTLADSATMLRRNLKHQLRYPSLTIMLAGLPVVFLLLFVYVFGGQLGTGLGGHGTADRSAYLGYVVPGILTMTVASAALGTAISVASDMTDGVTIFLTTQYLDEADELASYVAVLDHGRVVAEGTPAELKRRIPGGHVQLQFAELGALHAAAAMIPNCTADADQLILQVPGDGSIASLRRVLNDLDDARIGVENLSIHTPDLDDVFFAVTGHAAIEPTSRHEEEALQS